jgi:hypothetical protein
MFSASRGGHPLPCLRCPLPPVALTLGCTHCLHFRLLFHLLLFLCERHFLLRVVFFHRLPLQCSPAGPGSDRGAVGSSGHSSARAHAGHPLPPVSSPSSCCMSPLDTLLSWNRLYQSLVAPCTNHHPLQVFPAAALGKICMVAFLLLDLPGLNQGRGAGRDLNPGDCHTAARLTTTT